VRRLVVLAAVTTLLVASTAPARALLGVPNPAPLTFIKSLRPAYEDVERPPKKANRWDCRPSAAHPRAVVLVHGTAGNMSTNWAALSPALADAGYCVFALNYGGPPKNDYLYGFGRIEESAKQLGAFVDKVLAATHTTSVDIVGHSQGGMMPRWYMKFGGGSPKVHTLVGLAPSNHGTRLGNRPGEPPADPSPDAYCPACTQQMRGSRFLHELNAGGDTLPGVNYTVIETRWDQVVVPYTSAFLRGPNVSNILLQHVCVLDRSDHLNVVYSPVVIGLVKNALDPTHAKAVPCVVVLPGVS
jgi:triacylglycerol esterase/lipase EstA (alpha/beta hydrolase family)